MGNLLPYADLSVNLNFIYILHGECGKIVGQVIPYGFALPIGNTVKKPVGIILPQVEVVNQYLLHIRHRVWRGRAEVVEDIYLSVLFPHKIFLRVVVGGLLPTKYVVLICQAPLHNISCIKQPVVYGAVHLACPVKSHTEQQVVVQSVLNNRILQQSILSIQVFPYPVLADKERLFLIFIRVVKKLA